MMPRLQVRTRRGSTLIEAAIGSMMMAILIVPAMRALNDSESLRLRHESHTVMLFTAEERLEQEKVALCDAKYFDAAWSSGSGTDRTEQVKVDDGADLVCRMRVVADTSIGKSTAQLVTITVDVWKDANGDRRLDTTESRETLRTQWVSP